MKAGSREKYSTMPPSLLDYAAAAGVAALAATFYARYARRPQPSPPRSVAVETAPEKTSLPLPDPLHDFELESARPQPHLCQQDGSLAVLSGKWSAAFPKYC